MQLNITLPDSLLLGGSLHNTRLYKTAAYAVANADKGGTLALGGEAFYTVTLGDPTTFDDNFAIRILNEDDTRAKRVSPDGMTSFLLWPGQSRELFRSGAKWFASPIQRWTITSPVVFYVDVVNGSDLNDGLAPGAGAVASIAKAYHHIRDHLDLQYTGIPTIQLTSGQAFTEQLGVFGPLVGNLQFIIQGSTTSDPGDWANFLWQVPSGGVGIQTRDLGIVTVKGVKFVSTGTNAIALSASQFSVIDFERCDFGDFSGGLHMSAFGCGSINRLSGVYQISGNANSHMQCYTGSVIHTGGDTINCSAPLSFANGFMNISGGVINQAPVTYTGAGSSANTYGRQAIISAGGIGYNMTANPGTHTPLLDSGGQSL